MSEVRFPTQYDEFIQNLVFAMLGIKLVDFVSTKQDQIVESCVQVYKKFTLDFFTTNYPEFDLDKIQNMIDTQAIHSNITEDIKTKLDNCHNAFLVELSKSWEN